MNKKITYELRTIDPHRAWSGLGDTRGGSMSESHAEHDLVRWDEHVGPDGQTRSVTGDVARVRDDGYLEVRRIVVVDGVAEVQTTIVAASRCHVLQRSGERRAR